MGRNKKKGKKLSYQKRRNEIMKKVLELSLQCDVDATCICSSPNSDHRLTHFSGYKRTEDVLIRLINSTEPHIEQLVSQNKERLLNLLQSSKKKTERYYSRRYEPSPEDINSTREAEVHEAFLERALKTVQERMAELTLNADFNKNTASSYGVNREVLSEPNYRIQRRHEPPLDALKAIEDAFEMDDAVPEEAITALQAGLINELMQDEPREPYPDALTGVGAGAGSSFAMEDSSQFSLASLFQDPVDLQGLWTLDEALPSQSFQAQKGRSPSIQLDQAANLLQTVQPSSSPPTDVFNQQQSRSQTAANQMGMIMEDMIQYPGNSYPSSYHGLQQGVAFQSPPNTEPEAPINAQMPFQQGFQMLTNPGFSSWEYGGTGNSCAVSYNSITSALQTQVQNRSDHAQLSYNNNTSAVQPQFQDGSDQARLYNNITPEPQAQLFNRSDHAQLIYEKNTSAVQPHVQNRSDQPELRNNNIRSAVQPQLQHRSDQAQLIYNNIMPAPQPQLLSRSDHAQLIYEKNTPAVQPHGQHRSDQPELRNNNIRPAVQPQLQHRSDQAELIYNNITPAPQPQVLNRSDHAQLIYGKNTSAVQPYVQHRSDQPELRNNNIRLAVQPQLQHRSDQAELIDNNITPAPQPQFLNRSDHAELIFEKNTSAVQPHLQHRSDQPELSNNNIRSAVEPQLQHRSDQNQLIYNNITPVPQPQLLNRSDHAQLIYEKNTCGVQPHVQHRSDQPDLNYNNIRSAVQPQLQHRSDQTQLIYNITPAPQPQLHNRSDHARLSYEKNPSSVQPQLQHRSYQAEPSYNNIRSTVQPQIQHRSDQAQLSYNNITSAVQPQLQHKLDQHQQCHNDRASAQAQPRDNSATSIGQPQPQSRADPAEIFYLRATQSVFNPEFGSFGLPLDPYIRRSVEISFSRRHLSGSGVAPPGAGRGGFM